MSERERWKDLVDAIDLAAGVHDDGDHIGDGHDIARSICEHLGITWEMVDSTEHMPISGQVALAEAGEMVDQKDAMRDALATLLEAAGIER